jgi:nucleoside-diphosphate-sugar epimerase
LNAERLFESIAQSSYTRVDIGRFHNTYGMYCDWHSIRAKAPAALCRKVIQAQDGGSFDVWGDGRAKRNYTHVDFTVAAILALVDSNEYRPVNIGAGRSVSTQQLVNEIVRISGKSITPFYASGGIEGVRNRNFSHQRLYDLGVGPESFPYGMEELYEWIEGQIG